MPKYILTNMMNFEKKKRKKFSYDAIITDPKICVDHCRVIENIVDHWYDSKDTDTSGIFSNCFRLYFQFIFVDSMIICVILIMLQHLVNRVM